MANSNDLKRADIVAEAFQFNPQSRTLNPHGGPQQVARGSEMGMKRLAVVLILGLAECGTAAAGADYIAEVSADTIVDNDPEDGSGPGDRPLRAWLPEGGSMRPDCANFIKEGKPFVEDVDCSFYDLGHSAVFYSKAARVVVLAVISMASDPVLHGEQQEPAFMCLKGGGESAYWPVSLDFDSVEVWKGTGGGTGAVFQGGCGKNDPGHKTAYVCLVGNTPRWWHISPGANLLFLNETCCSSQYSSERMSLTAIFPVQDGKVWDWDGTGVPIDDVKFLVQTTPTSTLFGLDGKEYPMGDEPCTGLIYQDPKDVIEPSPDAGDSIAEE